MVQSDPDAGSPRRNTTRKCAKTPLILEYEGRPKRDIEADQSEHLLCSSCSASAGQTCSTGARRRTPCENYAFADFFRSFSSRVFWFCLFHSCCRVAAAAFRAALLQHRPRRDPNRERPRDRSLAPCNLSNMLSSCSRRTTRSITTSGC
jgi:hypothetical protein